MEEKKILLEEAKVDHLVVIKFDHQFSRIAACDFIKDVLVEKIGTRNLIIGYNHHFGRRGEGDFNTIKQCFREPSVLLSNRFRAFITAEGAISSSLIREALLTGRLDEAKQLAWIFIFCQRDSS